MNPAQSQSVEPWYANMLPTVFMTLSLDDAAKADAPESSSGIGAIVAAARHIRDGDVVEGIAILEKTWQNGSEDPRVRLWAAHALRARGVTISGSDANRPLGVVLQVPVGSGIDTVGAYADGTFRYYNAVRGSVLVEPGALAINEAAKELASLASELRPASPAAGGIKITVLTPAGPMLTTAAGGAGQAVSAKFLSAVRLGLSLREEQANSVTMTKATDSERALMTATLLESTHERDLDIGAGAIVEPWAVAYWRSRDGKRNGQVVFNYVRDSWTVIRLFSRGGATREELSTLGIPSDIAFVLALTMQAYKQKAMSEPRSDRPS